MQRAIFFLILIAVFWVNFCWVEEASPKSLSGWEAFLGFNYGHLKGQKKLKAYNLFFDLDFDLKKITPSFKKYPGLAQFQIEPYISIIDSPRSNFGFGNAFAFKFGLFPETARFQPYAKIACGLSYMTLHTREQSTQFNFFEYAGLGFHYFLKPSLALVGEYRFSHLSNSSIRHPNHGINSYTALVGFSYRF